MTVVLARLCTICMARQKLVPATFIAQNAGQLQWYECDDHDMNDHHREFGTGIRTVHESKDAWFERHFGKDSGKKG